MSFKLTYFDMRGRAECIRIILNAAGQKFTDNRIKREEFVTLKPTLPWGQMPVLEVGDKTLCQTITICRYLGRKFNLYGANEWEAAKCDEYVDAMNDCFTEWAKYFFEQDPDKKKKLHDDFLSTTAPKFLSKFNTIAEKSGSQWLIGKDITWADIFIADKLDRLKQTEGNNILDPYPHLIKFVANVYAYPNIKAYVAQRVDSPM